MCDYKQRSDNSNYPDAADMAARLVADLGRPENLNMNYGTSSSGAYSGYAPRTFRNFGYTSADEMRAMTSEFRTSIRKGYPVYMAGNVPAENSSFDLSLGISTAQVEYGSGHAWVVDTFLQQKNGGVRRTDIISRMHSIRARVR